MNYWSMHEMYLLKSPNLFGGWSPDFYLMHSHMVYQKRDGFLHPPVHALSYVPKFHLSHSFMLTWYIPCWETYRNIHPWYTPKIAERCSFFRDIWDSPSLPREKAIVANNHTLLSQWSSISKWGLEYRNNYWRILFLGIPRKSNTCANSEYHAGPFPPRRVRGYHKAVLYSMCIIAVCNGDGCIYLADIRGLPRAGNPLGWYWDGRVVCMLLCWYVVSMAHLVYGACLNRHSPGYMP